MDLRLFDAKQFGHFLIQETFAGTVGLYPFSVDDKLRDRAFASLLNHLVGGSGGVFNIDFVERDAVLLQKTFSLAAVWAPQAGIESNFHREM
jgi:hypothetical protein